MPEPKLNSVGVCGGDRVTCAKRGTVDATGSHCRAHLCVARQVAWQVTQDLLSSHMVTTAETPRVTTSRARLHHARTRTRASSQVFASSHTLRGTGVESHATPCVTHRTMHTVASNWHHSHTATRGKHSAQHQGERPAAHRFSCVRSDSARPRRALIRRMRVSCSAIA